MFIWTLWEVKTSENSWWISKKVGFQAKTWAKIFEKIENFDHQNFVVKHLILHENDFNNCPVAWLCQKLTSFYQLGSENVKNMWFFLAIFLENAQKGSILRVFQPGTPKNHLFSVSVNTEYILVAYFDQIFKIFAKFFGDTNFRFFFKFFSPNFGLKSDFSTDPTAIFSCFNISEGSNKHVEASDNT